MNANHDDASDAAIAGSPSRQRRTHNMPYSAAPPLVFAPSAASSDGDNHRLSWRMDAAESLSDWTIQIITKNNNGGNDDEGRGGGASSTTSTDTYHVHRCILAVGPTRMEYFACLFRNEYAETDNKTSRIELVDLAAQAFPTLLDYCYYAHSSSSYKLAVTHENAMALIHLANYLGVKRVGEEVKEFMTVQHCGTYYRHAKILMDEQIRQAIVELCAFDVARIHNNCAISILDASDVGLWLGIASILHPIGSHDSFCLSELVAEFCCRNSDDLSAQDFLELTKKNSLPCVSPAAGEKLLLLEASILQDENQQNDGSAANNARACLQNRCIGALSSAWMTHEISSESLSKLSHSVVCTLLKKNRQNAMQSVDGCLLPENIIVQGAGNPVVNGTYYPKGLHEHAPRYVKEGISNYGLVEFCLFRCTLEPPHCIKKWFITVVPEGCEAGKNTDIDFYSVQLNPWEPLQPKPPKTGWKLAAEGIEPPPTLVYHHA